MDSPVLSTLFLGFGIGVVTGLRAMTPLAVVSWAIWSRWFNVDGTWLALLGARFAPWIVTLLALGELIGDKLPTTPSRTVPPAFIARVMIGLVVGWAIGMHAGDAALGGLAGGLGAVAGTLGGRAARGWLARALGRDLPAALIEDAVTILGAALIVGAAR